MFKKIGQTAVFLLALTGASCCYADSISTAIGIVEGFETESAAIVSLFDPKDTSGTRLSLKQESTKAVDELKTLGWTHAPGDIRYRQTVKIVDSYTERVIKAVSSMDSGVRARNGSKVAESVKKLEELKAAFFTELTASRKKELEAEKPVRPVPLIDRSPYDTTPGNAPGIWYR